MNLNPPVCFDKKNQPQGLYVRPNFGRLGIGTRILTFLELEAISAGLLYLFVDASIKE